MKKCKVCGTVVQQSKVGVRIAGLYPKIEWIYCDKCKKERGMDGDV